MVWYHTLQRLKVAEFAEGDIITRAGERGPCAYWLLTGEGCVGGGGVGTMPRHTSTSFFRFLGLLATQNVTTSLGQCVACQRLYPIFT